MKLIIEDWLVEQDIPPMGGQPDMAAGMGGGALGTGPGGMPQAGPAGTDPNQQPPDPNQPPPPDITNQGVPEQPDVSQDPKAPDMPDEPNEMDFDQWRTEFFKTTVNGDPNECLDLLKQIRERTLETYERKFVEDNIQIQKLRQNANIKQASDKIQKAVKDELDKNNPGVSIVGHMEEVLKTMPELTNVFIKITGLLEAKAGGHRKYLAALLNAVQVGNGAATEDIIVNTKDYSIGISTRFNAQFGDVTIGKWELQEDDVKRFLKEPEINRLENGSPEEKDALRKRLVIESIAEKFKTRTFLINVVDTDGTVILVAWDLANSLRSAFKEGKIVVKLVKSDNSEAMIEDNGTIVRFMDIKINYRKSTGKLDADGNKEYQELPFVERRDGILFLVADVNLVSEASSTFQGMSCKLIPYNGNPSDLKQLARSVPDITELLLRNP